MKNTHTQNLNINYPNSSLSQNDDNVKEKFDVLYAIRHGDVEGIETASKIAVMVVTKTLLQQLKNEGSTSQYNKIYELYRDARVHNITNPDIEDLLSVAMVSFYNSALEPDVNNDTMFKNAYRAIRNEVYSAGKALLSKDGKELPRGYSKHDPYLSNETRNAIVQLFDMLHDVLRPKQRDVLDCLCMGYTQTEVAELLGRTKSTISEHTSAIRRTSTSFLNTVVGKTQGHNKWRFTNGTFEVYDNGAWVAVDVIDMV